MPEISEEQLDEAFAASGVASDGRLRRQNFYNWVRVAFGGLGNAAFKEAVDKLLGR